MGDYDPDTELFEPLQKLLDQCKGAKALSRKLTKRLEDLTHDSGALKAQLLPQLRALNNLVPDIVDFGISVCIPPDFPSYPLANIHRLACTRDHASSR